MQSHRFTWIQAVLISHGGKGEWAIPQFRHEPWVGELLQFVVVNEQLMGVMLLDDGHIIPVPYGDLQRIKKMEVDL
jgi:hypothetical protein